MVYNIFVFNGNNYLLYQESNREWFSISKSEFIKKYKDKTYDLYVNNSLKGSFIFSVIDNKLEMINKKNNVITRYTKDNYFLYGGNGDIEYCNLKSSNITSDEYKDIYTLINNQPIDINEIIRQSKINSKEVMSKLTMLELEGKIKRVYGNKYVKI